jgi:hypothetical protein
MKSLLVSHMIILQMQEIKECCYCCLCCCWLPFNYEVNKNKIQTDVSYTVLQEEKQLSDSSNYLHLSVAIVKM